MKYIKKFENKQEEHKKYTKKFFNNITKLVKFYFEEYDVKAIIKDDFRIDFYHNKGKSRFLSFILTYYYVKENNNLKLNRFEIYIDRNYTDIDIYKKIMEFQNYFISLAKPLSTKIDQDEVEFIIYLKEFIYLTSLLTIEEYKLRADTYKYNI